MSQKTVSQPTKRLASLDILRGADLFLLCFIGPVVSKLRHAVDAPWFQSIAYQCDHAAWEGFRVWDIIMPLFLFMAGAAMPFSLSKYRGDKPRLYRKVVRRFIILFLLGIVAQGNLLDFDPDTLHIYVNTLQAIAAGYLIAAVILTELNTRGQIVATLALLFFYWLPMTLCGDYTVEGNLACRIDAAVMGRFQGDPTYSWLLSSLTFGVTTMLGAFAGRIIKEHAAKKPHVPLLLGGVGLIVVSLLWSLQMPIIKHIWTCSMTLFSGGICWMLLGLFYWWIDYRHHSRGLNWLKFYGMNSITAYMLRECIDFSSVTTSLCYGLEQFTGDYYRAVVALGNVSIVFLILWLMYRNKVFLKI